MVGGRADVHEHRPLAAEVLERVAPLLGVLRAAADADPAAAQRHLVDERGWSTSEWVDLCAGTLVADLLGNTG